MNIYVLDRDIERCAQAHCDRHVIESIEHGTQMLCTALNRKGMTTPYPSANVDHPCALWLQGSFDNFLWLKDLVFFLNDEYRYRFERDDDHAAIEALRAISGHRYGRHGQTPFVQAIPQRYRVPGDPVAAYRRFYLAETVPTAHWTRREPPAWTYYDAYARAACA